MKDRLSEAEVMGLQFLENVGTDCIGVIDDEGKMAAAIVFLNLQQRGLVIAEISPDGPVYRLTPAGRSALANTHGEGRESGQ